MKRFLRTTVAAATITFASVFASAWAMADEVSASANYAQPKDYLITVDGFPWGTLHVTCDLNSPDCRILPSHEFAASLGIDGDCGMVSVHELRVCLGVWVDANPDGYIVRLRTNPKPKDGA